jgi:hypothetical protein
MLRKLFVEHPQSVGESYFEHMGVAFSFGFSMMGAALACIIHGFVPGLFKSTGSKAIMGLYDRLVTNRCRKAVTTSQSNAPQTIAMANQSTLDFCI